MITKQHLTAFLLISASVLVMCKKKEDNGGVTPSGSISFSIEHKVNGQPLALNELIYTNAAGNQYMISDLMYFISDIILYRNDGTIVKIGAQKEIFYIDEHMPETKTILFSDKITAGTYDSINFIFGISEEKNKSNMFVNPPEAVMGWPEVLGGGYHYMMMNGKWTDNTGFLMPFNFHLGLGQLYHGTTSSVDSIYAFVDNSFKVSLPGSSFVISDRQVISFTLTMKIDEWFENPHVYDHNTWGGAIMQNQEAMKMARENGWNVFSIEKI